MKYCTYCEKGKKKPAQFLGSTYTNLKRDAEEYYACLEHVGKMTRRMTAMAQHDTIAIRRIPKEA